jgi:AraC-like DNA-binding protein
VAQKLKRLAAQRQRDSLPLRSALLQFWAAAIKSILPQPEPVNGGSLQLRERFRELVARLPASELASAALPELAEKLHCSERHFSRLFREEFKVSLRGWQTGQRLQRASQLLAASDTKIASVAKEAGYRHLGLFNAMFKRQFGMTPSAWRQKAGVSVVVCLLHYLGLLAEASESALGQIGELVGR